MKEKGDLDAAFEMYSHCLDIYPQGAATLYEIAKFYMFLNQPDKGEKALKDAVASDPNNYWYNQTLAAYYQNKGGGGKSNLCIRRYGQPFSQTTGTIDVVGGPLYPH